MCYGCTPLECTCNAGKKYNELNVCIFPSSSNFRLICNRYQFLTPTVMTPLKACLISCAQNIKLYFPLHLDFMGPLTLGIDFILMDVYFK